MRLEHAHIENFKLLETVKLDFSTIVKPLTSSRRERLRQDIAPAIALGVLRQLRTTPGYGKFRLGGTPAQRTIDIRVMVEFSHTDGAGEEAGTGCSDRHRDPPRLATGGPRSWRLRLLRITAGRRTCSMPRALVGKLIRRDCRDIFFTNGDDVQHLRSGLQSTPGKRAHSHQDARARNAASRRRGRRRLQRLRAEAAQSVVR